MEKIVELENKINSLTERLDEKNPSSIGKFKIFLRSLDIEESYVQELVKKAINEISPEEILDFEFLTEFAIQEMFKEIKTGLAAFSKTDNGPVITLLISEVASAKV